MKSGVIRLGYMRGDKSLGTLVVTQKHGTSMEPQLSGSASHGLT
jgi:hypothetical protein